MSSAVAVLLKAGARTDIQDLVLNIVILLHIFSDIEFLAGNLSATFIAAIARPRYTNYRNIISLLNNIVPGWCITRLG